MPANNAECLRGAETLFRQHHALILGNLLRAARRAVVVMRLRGVGNCTACDELVDAIDQAEHAKPPEPLHERQNRGG